MLEFRAHMCTMSHSDSAETQTQIFSRKYVMLVLTKLVHRRFLKLQFLFLELCITLMHCLTELKLHNWNRLCRSTQKRQASQRWSWSEWSCDTSHFLFCHHELMILSWMEQQPLSHPPRHRECPWPFEGARRGRALGGFHIWRPQWVGGRVSPKSRQKKQNQLICESDRGVCQQIQKICRRHIWKPP